MTTRASTRWCILGILCCLACSAGDGDGHAAISIPRQSMMRSGEFIAGAIDSAQAVRIARRQLDTLPWADSLDVSHFARSDSGYVVELLYPEAKSTRPGYITVSIGGGRVQVAPNGRVVRVEYYQ